jgi:hypothetical protein
MYRAMEINGTLRCNSRCINCNRLPHLFENENTDVTLEQIDDLISQMKGKGIHTIKLLGGEMLLHPQFVQIYEKLKDALAKGVFGFFKIDTNYTIPIPIKESVPNIKWMGKVFRRKNHTWIFDPADLGFSTGAVPDCSMPRRCGISFDRKGFLPCSQAIGIVKKFGLEHLYRKEIQRHPWGLDEICKHCPISAPRDFIDKHTWNMSETPEEFKQPSKSYRR